MIELIKLALETLAEVFRNNTKIAVFASILIILTWIIIFIWFPV
ncbi:hypothetical protein SCB49_00375 [unidentified eubacterium SCB49]|nr:hypothetical protein SCB49_00375 [unidentified eubacterium SCB49]